MWGNGHCFSLHPQTATQALTKVEKEALGWQPTGHQLLRPGRLWQAHVQDFSDHMVFPGIFTAEPR